MKYLVHFYDEWSDFKHAEFVHLLALFGGHCYTDVTTGPPVGTSSSSSTYLPVELPDDHVARLICSRSVLVKHIIHLWSDGHTFDEMFDGLGKVAHQSECQTYLADPRLKWSLVIDPYCKSWTHEQQESCRKHFAFLNFQGPVRVKEPDVEYVFLVNYQSAIHADYDSRPAVPCYFGRQVAHGGMRKELKKYDLKQRIYLGPTSLDHALAFIMANLAHVKKGMLVLDPFVGTGSILIALAHFGAKCFGTDIDLRVLNGDMYAGIYNLFWPL